MKYDEEETLKEGKATLLHGTERDEMVQSLTSFFGRMVVCGAFKMPDKRDSDRFPDLRLKRVDEMINDAWTGR